MHGWFELHLLWSQCGSGHPSRTMVSEPVKAACSPQFLIGIIVLIIVKIMRRKTA